MGCSYYMLVDEYAVYSGGTLLVLAGSGIEPLGIITVRSGTDVGGFVNSAFRIADVELPAGEFQALVSKLESSGSVICAARCAANGVILEDFDTYLDTSRSVGTTLVRSRRGNGTLGAKTAEGDLPAGVAGGGRPQV